MCDVCPYVFAFIYNLQCIASGKYFPKFFDYYSNKIKGFPELYLRKVISAWRRFANADGLVHT